MYKVKWVVLAWIVFVQLGVLLAWITFTWEGFIIAIALYLVTAWGVTAGMHRLFTHVSFHVPRWLQCFIGFVAQLSGEGSVIEWVANHRKHHRFSDQKDDPHTPLDGFWWAHMLWLFKGESAVDRRTHREKYAPDLIDDPYFLFLDRTFIVWHLLLAGILYGAGHLASGVHMGVSLLVWGMFVRMTAVLHVTWCVNSITHMWGYRNYPDTGDRSVNNPVIGILALGEGWHNNHHAKPTACNQGHYWWEIDPTYWTIMLLRLVGLADNVKYFHPETGMRTLRSPFVRENYPRKAA